MPFLAQLKQRIIHILSCCDKNSNSHQILVIGPPTDFQRMDVNLPGLTAEQQAFFREKARIDVERLHSGESPLPSPTFPRQHTFNLHNLATSTDARTSDYYPLVSSPTSFVPVSGLGKLRQHGRRISAHFRLNEGADNPASGCLGMPTRKDGDDTDSAYVSRRESLDSKHFEDKMAVNGEWAAGRSSITLGGGASNASEKGSKI